MQVEMNSRKINTLDDSFGKIYRHKRLFNYVVSPVNVDNGLVKCHVGKNSYREFPVEYFARDWKTDESIKYSELLEKIIAYPDKTPFTSVYVEYYEPDDGLEHSYIHFNDDVSEKIVRFPVWRLTKCSKTERNERINPFTLIMPVMDGCDEEIQNDLDIMNDIRKANEIISIEDFHGFEFGLIKYLEKKYLREI